jgi:hypothetical protein
MGNNFTMTQLPNGGVINHCTLYDSYLDADGGLHREDGPAVVFRSTSPMGPTSMWGWRGHNYDTFEEWLIKATISDERKMLLRLQYG